MILLPSFLTSLGEEPTVHLCRLRERKDVSQHRFLVACEEYPWSVYSLC
jgi:hypothetical protein